MFCGKGTKFTYKKNRNILARMPTNCICCACFFVVIIMSYTADKERLQKTLSDSVLKSTLQPALKCSCSALGFYFVCIMHILYTHLTERFFQKIIWVYSELRVYTVTVRVSCSPVPVESMKWFRGGVLPLQNFSKEWFLFYYSYNRFTTILL